MFPSALSRFPDPASGTLAPQQPPTVTVKLINNNQLHLQWPDAQGDFDRYLIIFYDGKGRETNRQYFAKGINSYTYTIPAGKSMWSFHTEKGGIISVNANTRAGK